MNHDKYDPFAVPEGYDPNAAVLPPAETPSFWTRLSGSSWANALAFLLALAAAMAVIYLPRYLNPPQADKFVTVGFPFPVFQLEALSDDAQLKDFTSFQLTDKVSLLTLWGPWNPQSVNEMERLKPIVKNYSSDPRFQFVSVAYTDNQIVGPQAQKTDDGKALLETYPQSSADKKVFREKVAKTLASLEISDKNTYWDPEGMLANAFYLSQPAGKQQFCLPLTILIDQQKTIRAVWLGFEPGLETQIAHQLENCMKNAASATDMKPKQTFALPPPRADSFASPVPELNIQNQ